LGQDALMKQGVNERERNASTASNSFGGRTAPRLENVLVEKRGWKRNRGRA